MSAQVKPNRAKVGLFLIGATGAIIALISLIAPSGFDEGMYFDPKSSDPVGIKAMVLMLEGLGAEVDEVSELPIDGYDVAMIFEDYLGDSELDAMNEWVNEGGTLVIADIHSSLMPFTASFNDEEEDSVLNDCDVAALSEVGSISQSNNMFRATDGAQACFGNGVDGQVVIGPAGEGTIVAIANPEIFTNENISKEDNALLAAALLASRSGVKVALVGDAQIGDGADTIGSLMGDRVNQGIFQLVAGFLMYVLWRARRLGNPVSETLPVELSASDLVRSMGNLLHKAQCREQVGQLLNDDLRRRLTRRLNLATNSPAQEVAEVAAERTGLAVERFQSVLIPSPLNTDSDLVALGVAIEKIDQEVGHV